MGTFEERILQFLDGEASAGGPLDESAREALLREVAESPEKRRLFIAHLKLREVLSVGQKPDSAPLAVQRDLAQKLPVLALHLPYLAEDAKREKVAGFWTTSSVLMRTALVVGLLALTGTAWYLFSVRSEHSTAYRTGAATSSADHNSPLSTKNDIPPTATNSGTQTASSETQSTESTSHVAERASSPVAAALPSSIDRLHRTTTATTHSRNSEASHSHGSMLSSSAASRASEPNDEHTVSNAPIQEQKAPVVIAEKEKAPDVTPSTPAQNKPVEPSANAAENISKPAALQLPYAAAMRKNFSLWAAPELTLRFLPNVTLSETPEASRFTTLSGATLAMAYWLGAEQQLSENWVAGVRAGYVPLARMQSFTYSEPTPGYPLLKRYKKQTRLVDTSSIAYGPSISYLLGTTSSDLRLNAFAALGTGDLNWLAGLSMSLAYHATTSLAVRTSLGLGFTSSRAAAPGGEPLPATFTLGVKELGSVPATLVTPAVTASIGIVLVP